jgi:hypothetical protein
LKTVITFLLLSSVLTVTLLANGTTGKIAGSVIDSKTREKLIGVNVIIEGTSLGASTNIDGYFAILNVLPGTYRVKASYIGYTPSVFSDVRVSIDQTTIVDFTLVESSISTQEVVVVATRPVVQKDVAASSVNLNSTEVENLPVSSVSSIIGLQAGIQGLSVRGSNNSDQLAFQVNGFTLRDERDNTPYTGIALTSIQEYQIQTGGFNAEYGNVRSGIVNAVTKEGSRDKYNVGFITRYHNPTQKHFGASLDDPNFYWLRPYLDPAVAWTGTQNGAWDYFTQQQYPKFDGWNIIAQRTLQDSDPTNDLTPAAAQQLFLWQHRKKLDIDKPDYDVDASIGGPVPLVGEMLGNLRFFASYRQAVSRYVVPLSADGLTDQSGQLKLISDVGEGKKLIIEGLVGKTSGTNSSRAGGPGFFSSNEGIANQLDRVSFIDARIFSNDYWNPTSRNISMIGAKLSHVLSSETFYEASLQVFHSSYETNPGRSRDTSRIASFGGVLVDEAPFGFWPLPSNGVDNMRMSVGFSNSRDTSRLTTYTAKFDFSSQLDSYNQFKAGAEFVLTDNNVNYATVDPYLPASNSVSRWHTYPIRGALYFQDKLEFQGMIANLGLRFDYSDPRGDWYVIANPYDAALAGSNSLGIDTLIQKEPVKKTTTLSPRLGIAFPITENSKLFFNYGHFRQMPSPEDLFLVRRQSIDGSITRLANPNNPLPKTVAYELGFEHNLWDQYLIRLAGYYKDISDQPRNLEFISQKKDIDYTMSSPDSYEDTRGIELTLSKNRGEWLQGFINYTYQLRTVGNFGYAQLNQATNDQRIYERDHPTDLYQTKPVPQPYGRANIDLFTPGDYGPEMAGLRPLADWRFSFLGRYQSGEYFTWAGGGSIPGIINNVQWSDNWGIDLRLSKTFNIAGANVQLFVDMNNAFNIQTMNRFSGYVDATDFNSYMKSLHLPSDIAGDGITQKLGYVNIPGGDHPGQYPKEGSVFTPMVGVAILPGTAQFPTAIYFEGTSGKYFQYVNNAWVQASQGLIDQIIADKSYIDMPNETSLSFLNPRLVFFGLKVSFNIY